MAIGWHLLQWLDDLDGDMDGIFVICLYNLEITQKQMAQMVALDHISNDINY